MDMMPQGSKLHYYSVGVVAANKKLDTHFIEVVPMEETPMVDGEITDDTQKYKAKSQNDDGQAFSVEVETTGTIRAEWLPIGEPNRITSPDVRRGEIVQIYRFGDTDDYRWVTLLQDKKLRRLETVIWSFSDNREENVPNDAKSTYYLEVSTHKKYIHLHTAKSDKEPFVYDIQINTKDGCITIKDDDGNFIYLDSQERRIKLENRDTSTVDIDKRKIRIFAPDLVQIESKRIELTATESIETRAQETTINSSHTQNNVPTTDFSGSINVAATVTGGNFVGDNY